MFKRTCDNKMSKTKNDKQLEVQEVAKDKDLSQAIEYILLFLGTFESIDSYFPDQPPNKVISAMKKIISQVPKFSILQSIFKPFVEKRQWFFLISSANIQLLADYEDDPILLEIGKKDSKNYLSLNISDYLKKCIVIMKDFFYKSKGTLGEHVVFGNKLMAELTLILTYLLDLDDNDKTTKLLYNANFKYRIDGVYIFRDHGSRKSKNKPGEKGQGEKTFEDYIIEYANELQENSVGSSNFGSTIDMFLKNETIMDNIKYINSNVDNYKNIQDPKTLVATLTTDIIRGTAISQSEEITAMIDLVSNMMIPSGIMGGDTGNVNNNAPQDQVIQLPKQI